jgi:hypothetical protein
MYFIDTWLPSAIISSPLRVISHLYRYENSLKNKMNVILFPI